VSADLVFGDEKSVLFIRNGPAGASAQSPGGLYLAPTAGHYTTLPLGRSHSWASPAITTEHYVWSAALDWHQP
jgi:hypothetical protein